MLGLILAAALSQAEPQAEQGQNDLKNPSVEPQAVHVAICNGTDIDGKEVMLLDRQCLNRPLVVAVLGTIDALARDRDDKLKMLNDANKQLAESKSKEGVSPLGVALISTGVAAVVVGVVLGGLKAAGKLQ